MTNLERLLSEIRYTQGCEASPPRGQPQLRDCDVLPDDLREFYRHCGGLLLFRESLYPVRIVGPEGFVRSNPEIVGAEYPDDITDSWYIVARGGLEDAISIDCNQDRLGRCYDSFWDRHGVAGDCRVIALSFTELVERLFQARGQHWYWLSGFDPGYGDAYS